MLIRSGKSAKGNYFKIKSYFSNCFKLAEFLYRSEASASNTQLARCSFNFHCHQWSFFDSHNGKHGSTGFFGSLGHTAIYGELHAKA